MGKLNIGKTVHSTVADDLAHLFKFRVTIEGGNNESEATKKIKDDNNGYYGTGVKFKDNVAVIEVKNGETNTIENLPIGLKYRVEELKEDDSGAYTDKFTTSIISDTTTGSDMTSDTTPTLAADAVKGVNGEVSPDGTGDTTANSAAFLNARKTGSLSITKNLSNAISTDAGDVFYFDVEILGDDAKPLILDDANAPIQVGAARLTATTAPASGSKDLWYEKVQGANGSTAKGIIHNVPVTLGANGAAATTTITGLPIGTTYTVKEQVSNTADSDLDEADRNKGDGLGWTMSSNTLLADNIKALSAEHNTGTIGSSNLEAEFTNERKCGNLKITKTVVSPVTDELDDPFRVKLTLSPVPAKKEYTISANSGTELYDDTAETDKNRKDSVDNTNGKVMFDVSGVAYVYVKGGQTLTITNLPTDVVCTVVEEEETGAESSYTDYGTPVYEPVAASQTNAINTTSAVTRSITNTRNTGSLKVTKEVSGDVPGDSTHPFKFRLTLTPPAGSTNYELVSDVAHGKDSEGNDIKFDYNYNSGTRNVAEFSVKAGQAQPIVIDNLPLGWGYKIEELKETGDYDSDYFTTTVIKTPETATETPATNDAVMGVSGTVSADSDSQVNVYGQKADFTNTRLKGSLNLRKAITNPIPGDASTPFALTVTLTNAAGLPLSGSGAIKVKNGSTTQDSITWNNKQYAAGDNTVVTQASVTLNVSSSDSFVLENVPYGTTYNVTEDISSFGTTWETGYTLTPAQAERKITAASATAKVTNTRSTGSLKLEKSVQNSPVDAENGEAAVYQFKVKLYGTGNGTGWTSCPKTFQSTVIEVAGGNVEFDNNGEATIQIPVTATIDPTTKETSAYGTVILSGIPVGVSYEVTELGSDRFTKKYELLNSDATYTDQTTSGKVTGSIVKGAASASQTITGAKITNTRQTGSLTVEKNVVSSVEADKTTREYCYTVQLDLSALVSGSNPTINPDMIFVKRYTKTNGVNREDDSFDGKFDTAGKLEFKLTDNQYVKIDNLPTGVKYSVTETGDNDFIAEWEKAQVNEMRVSIPERVTDGSNVVFTDDSSTEEAENEIKVDQPSTVTYTNTRKTGSLTINKTLLNAIPDDNGDIFYFDVELEREGNDKVIAPSTDAPITVGKDLITQTSTSAPSGENPLLYYTYEGGKGTIHNVTVQVTRSANSMTAVGHITITGIPVGTTYRVTESASWTPGTSELPAENIQINTPAAAKADYSGTVDASETSHMSRSAAFQNTRISLGKLTIQKVLTEAYPITAEEAEEYKIVLTLKTKNGGKPVDKIKLKINEEEKECTADSEGNLFFDIKPGENNKVVIEGIPRDLTYTVTEPESYNSRFNVTYVGATGDFVDNTNTEHTATVTNTRKYYSLVVNKKVTGAMGDRGEDFTFTLNVSGTGIDENREFSIAGYKPDGTNNEWENNATIRNRTTFKLKHDTSVIIGRIPADATVTLEEKRRMYTTHWDYYQGNWVLNNSSGNWTTYGDSGSTSATENLTYKQFLDDPKNTNGTTLSGTSEVQFTMDADGTLLATNNLDPVSPTDEKDNTKPFAASALAAMAVLAFGYLSKKKKRRKPHGSGPGGGGVL